MDYSQPKFRKVRKTMNILINDIIEYAPEEDTPMYRLLINLIDATIAVLESEIEPEETK